MQSINLNLVPGSFQQVFNCSQGDIGRQLTAKLLDGSTAYEIPAGSTVKIKATKPSGFGFDESATFSGSTVTITTAETMTNEWGRFPAELVITKDGNVIGTANFLFNIEKNPHPDSTVDGDAEEVIPELTLLVERVEAAASSVLDMEVVATTLPAGSQASYSYDEDLNKATFGIPQGEAGAGAAGVVASAYSSSKTYKVGDYVIHNSNLYRCITAITTAEAFTAAHWTQIVLADDVSDLKTDLGDISESNKNLWTAEPSYTFVKSQVVQFGVTYPAGRYCISAVCTSSDTDVSVCRISIGGKSVDLSRGARASGYFDASTSFDSCTIFAGQNSSTSAGDTATWADIQLEVGAYATDYVPHRLTAKDDIARAKIDSLVKYVATDGNDSNDGNTRASAYATISKALSVDAEVIYIAKGTYTEAFSGYYLNRNIKLIGDNVVIAQTGELSFRYSNVDISGITFDLTNNTVADCSAIIFLNCNVSMKDCVSKNAQYMGFRFDGSKAYVERCEAINSAIDGFNAHDITTGYISEGTFINCVANGCGDDGLSFHEDGKIHVIGGKYTNNGSTGIALANDCSAEIYNAYIYGNGAGIECFGRTDQNLAEAIIIGNIILNNNKVGEVHDTNDIGYGIHAKYYNVKTLGNVVEGNNSGAYFEDTGATLTVYTETPNN